MNANGPGAGGSAAATSALGSGATPTGRLRSSEHDGVKPIDEQSFSYQTEEASAFANAVYALPGTFLGGQVKIAGMVGGNHVDALVKSNSTAILAKFQHGRGDNNSLIAGGSLMWSSGSLYGLASVVGFRGSTTLDETIDTCPACPLKYSFDTAGVMASAIAGKVFDVPGLAGVKLDLRGSVDYIENKGDTFLAQGGTFQQTYTFSTWSGTLGATLFSQIPTESGGVFRPYLQALVRQEWNYKNQLVAVAVADDPDNQAGTFKHDQAHTYGGLSAGVTYQIERLTFGAGFYSELSSDERSVGGRLGASYLLGGTVEPAQVRAAVPEKPKNWSGFYGGAHFGGAGERIGLINNGPDEFFSTTGSRDNLDAFGVLGGVQVGYAQQLAGVVVGVEAEWSRLALRQVNVGSLEAFGGFVNDNTLTELSQTYALALRVGLPMGSFLPYLKAGYAGGRIKSEFFEAATPNFISSSTNWHEGWVAGAGFEYMLGRNWSIGLEYERFSFADKDVSAERTNDHNIQNWRVSPDALHTVNARLNIRFD